MSKIKSKQIIELNKFTTDDVSQGIDNKYASATNVRAHFSAASPIVYTQGTGVISTTLTQYTDELAQDATASLLSNGTHTGISYTYNDSLNKIDSTVSLSSFSIDALSDVDVSTKQTGEFLSWNGVNWVNATFSASITKPTLFASTSNAYVPSAISASVVEAIYKLSPTANATVTLTNISAVGNAGVKLTFKKTTGFLIQIIPKSGESIDGFTAGTDIVQQYACLTIVSDGSNWLII